MASVVGKFFIYLFIYLFIYGLSEAQPIASIDTTMVNVELERKRYITSVQFSRRY
jgi:hypothetical protein